MIPGGDGRIWKRLSRALRMAAYRASGQSSELEDDRILSGSGVLDSQGPGSSYGTVGQAEGVDHGFPPRRAPPADGSGHIFTDLGWARNRKP